MNAKLSDYGIACYATSSGLTQSVGTPGYRAPELLLSTAAYMSYYDKVGLHSRSPEQLPSYRYRYLSTSMSHWSEVLCLIYSGIPYSRLQLCYCYYYFQSVGLSAMHPQTPPTWLVQSAETLCGL